MGESLRKLGVVLAAIAVLAVVVPMAMALRAIPLVLAYFAIKWLGM